MANHTECGCGWQGRHIRALQEHRAEAHAPRDVPSEILEILEEGPASGFELSYRLGLDLNHVVGWLTQLSNDGMLERKRSGPAYRRRYRYALRGALQEAS